MTDVFISYARADKGAATRLRDELQSRGYQVCWDEPIRDFGTLWRDELADALKEARVVILIISHGYLQSNYCMMEAERAMSTARVLPIALHGFSWSDLRGSLLTEHHSVVLADFSSVRFWRWLARELDEEHSKEALEPHQSVDRDEDVFDPGDEVQVFAKTPLELLRCSRDRFRVAPKSALLVHRAIITWTSPTSRKIGILADRATAVAGLTSVSSAPSGGEAPYLIGEAEVRQGLLDSFLARGRQREEVARAINDSLLDKSHTVSRFFLVHRRANGAEEIAAEFLSVTTPAGIVIGPVAATRSAPQDCVKRNRVAFLAAICTGDGARARNGKCYAIVAPNDGNDKAALESFGFSAMEMTRETVAFLIEATGGFEAAVLMQKQNSDDSPWEVSEPLQSERKMIGVTDVALNYPAIGTSTLVADAYQALRANDRELIERFCHDDMVLTSNYPPMHIVGVGAMRAHLQSVAEQWEIIEHEVGSPRVRESENSSERGRVCNVTSKVLMRHRASGTVLATTMRDEFLVQHNKIGAVTRFLDQHLLEGIARYASSEGAEKSSVDKISD